MKLKTLQKKIRRLETRLQEGPQKLARLKSKLAALVQADAAEARRKLIARAAAARPATRPATAVRKRKRRPTAGAAPVKRTPAPRKAKRKLNLSPERRAQLADAMRARWAAKRAAADATR